MNEQMQIMFEITPASAKVKRMKYTERIMSIDPRIPTPGDG